MKVCAIELSVEGEVLPTCAAYVPECGLATTLTGPLAVQPVKWRVSKPRLVIKPGGGGGAVMLSATLVVCVAEAAVPVTAIEELPAAAPEATMTVIAELPPAVAEVGLNETLTPAGSAPVEKLTVSGVPLVDAVEMVEPPDWPCWMESAPGLDEMEKSFAGGGVEEQPGSLKEPMRVFQLKVPLLGMYSLVSQNVQSSLGSTASCE